MTQSVQESAVGLADIWKVIEGYKRIVIAAPIILGFLAFIWVTFLAVPTWEATGILQIGQVGQIGQNPKFVEPIPNVVSRMMHPSFTEKMLKESSDLKAAKGIYKGMLKVESIKGTDLIRFRVRGYSADMAALLARQAVDSLQKIHDEMMQGSIARINSQVEFVTTSLETLEAEAKLLNKRIQGSPDWNSCSATLAATWLQNNNNQVRNLAEKKLLLVELLSPSITYSTQVVGELEVSEGPVSPRKALIVGLATLVGLIGGIFFAFVHNFLRQNAPQK